MPENISKMRLTDEPRFADHLIKTLPMNACSTQTAACPSELSQTAKCTDYSARSLCFPTGKKLPFGFEYLVGVACLLSLGGCAGIGDSLSLQSSVLVKVPNKDPIVRASGGGWEFRHALEAPKDPDQSGQWYVAWNNSNPIHTNAMRHWPVLFSRASEIADATHAGLDNIRSL